MKIPKIGQGTGHKGQDKSTFEKDRKRLVKNVKFGISQGLCLIDTAEVYTDGRSEMIVGEAIRGQRDKVIVATKFSPNHNSYSEVINSAQNSLLRLQTDYIDLYQVHWPNNKIPLDETLAAMWDLQQGGLIKEVGLSNFSLSQLEKAQYIARSKSKKIYSVQIKFNLLDHSAYSHIKDFCNSNGIKIIAYSPLRFIFSQKSTLLKDLIFIAKKLGVSPAQVAVSWIISHENVTALVESSKLENLKEISKADQITIAKEYTLILDSHFRNSITELHVNHIHSNNPEREALSGSRSRDEILKFNNDFCPSVTDLSEELDSGGFLQPIVVRKSSIIPNKFEIIEGELRFWSFVIEFGPESKIPTIVV